MDRKTVHYTDKYVTAPVVYFLMRDDQKIVPIAIQLHQHPDPTQNPIFTPHTCSARTWRIAKMWVCILSHPTFGLSIAQWLQRQPVMLETWVQFPACSLGMWEVWDDHTTLFW